MRVLQVPRTLTPATVARMQAELRALGPQAPAEALVLRGSGDCFCLGMDLSALSASSGLSEVAAAMEAFAQVLLTLCRMPRPVIAVVQGRAAGGGVGLAAAADYVAASRAADFTLPEVLLGIVPGMVYPVIRRRVGVAPLNIMAIDGDARSADEALKSGLVDEVVDGDRLESRVRRLCKIMSRGHPRSIGGIKSLERLGQAEELEGAVRRGMAATLEMLAQPDTLARMKAMQEGGAPWLD